MVLTALSVGVALISGVFGGIIIARQRFDLSNTISVGVASLRVIVLILVLRAGYAMVALAMLQLGAGLLTLLLSLLVSRRIYPELRPSFVGWNRSHLHELVTFSLTTTGLAGARVLIVQLDAIVIGWFLPMAAVTFYAIAGNLLASAGSTISAISYTITPRVSALEGAGAIDEAESLPLAGARISTLLLLPIVVTFMVRGGTFIGLWMGPEYAGPSGQILWILALPLWFQGGRQVMAAALIGLNRHRLLIFPYLVEGAVNLALSIILVQTYGIAGVAWGTAIPRVIISAGVLPFLYNRVLNIPVTRFWIEVWLRPTVALIPFALATYTMERLGEPGSVMVFFAQVTILLPIAGLGAWFFGLTSNDQRIAKSYWHGATGS